MVNDHWLARIELAEARANAAEAERDLANRRTEALLASNAVDLGRAITLERERDRYREALESIANPYVLDAEAQTWIARAALGLDGEG